MERERERSAQRRESTRTTLGRCSAAGRGGESMVFYRGAKYKLEFSSHARSSGFSSTTILFPPPLSRCSRIVPANNRYTGRDNER